MKAAELLLHRQPDLYTFSAHYSLGAHNAWLNESKLLSQRDQFKMTCNIYEDLFQSSDANTEFLVVFSMPLCLLAARC